MKKLSHKQEQKIKVIVTNPKTPAEASAMIKQISKKISSYFSTNKLTEIRSDATTP